VDKDLAELSFQHVDAELRVFCGWQSLSALARELNRQGCRRAIVVCGRLMSASRTMALLRRALGPALEVREILERAW
jgi:alcohol dehydrogenase class IV